MGERVDRRDEVGRRLVRLPGRLRQVPSVDQAVEDHEPSERVAVDGTERRLDGARSAPGAVMEAARSSIAASKPLSTSSTCGCAASVPRYAAAKAVAPPIMCSSTPRTVKSAHGVSRSSCYCADSADDVAKKFADLAELGQGIHCSSVRVEWTDRDASAALGGFAVKAGCDESASPRSARPRHDLHPR